MEPDVEREAADVEHDGQDFIRCSPLEPHEPHGEWNYTLNAQSVPASALSAKLGQCQLSSPEARGSWDPISRACSSSKRRRLMSCSSTSAQISSGSRTLLTR